jgi:hypothetical protein
VERYRQCTGVLARDRLQRERRLATDWSDVMILIQVGRALAAFEQRGIYVRRVGQKIPL